MGGKNNSCMNKHPTANSFSVFIVTARWLCFLAERVWMSIIYLGSGGQYAGAEVRKCA